MSSSFRFTRQRTVAVTLFMLIATVVWAFSPSMASGSTGGNRPATAAAAAPAFQGSGEYITIYAGDCVTQQNVFNLGDTVCMKAGDFPLTVRNFNYRRLSWVAPDLTIAEQILFSNDPQVEYFKIPTSGALAQLGTWYATTINVHSGRQANGKFYVRDPNLPSVDLSISITTPEGVRPADKAMYIITLHNPGPDYAEGILLNDEVPTNMTFHALKQISGPEFQCVTPEPGQIGRITCQSKGLGVEETAEIAVYYIVNPELRDGTVCTSQSRVSSAMNDLLKDNNYATAETMVPFPDAEGSGEIEP